MINRTLDNRYTILEHIGGGGMADVYRAHDQLLDRSVAVKILRSQFTNDEDFVSRFWREAQAAARLSHPNIVNIYDVGNDDDTYYIVMEYISGETLKDRINREKVLPVEIASRITLEIAEALEHAHQNNLVHCDIKPHNILITSTGRIKVTDFGIARAVTSATMSHTGTVLGSVHYFSPEQAKGGLISAKSDIYSLGVVLYELLTGQLPFSGETPISVALKHLQEEPRSVRELNPEIPPLVEAIVMKAMAKDISARYDNISVMIKELRHAQNYLRDEHTRRLSRDDFPTQILPRLDDDIVKPNNENNLTHENGQPKRKSKKWVWGLLLLLVLGFLTGAFLAFGKFWSSNEVTVPNVVGKPQETAKNILEGQNLRVSISETFNDKVPAGYVISQYPEPGSVVKEQRTITLVVSKGGEITVVPNLKGLSRRDAELTLKNAGLTIGRIDEQYSSDVPADIVISQNPRPPAQINKNSPVDIVVSKGAGPKKVVLPDFRGTPLNTVNSQLDSLKLKLGKVTEDTNDRYPAGTISGQTPAPGNEVNEGTVVDLTVSKGTTSTIKRAVVQVNVPEGPARQAVQIVVNDSVGRKVIYENVHKPGDRIEKPVEGVGQVKVQVYINGVLLQEQAL